MFLIRTAFWLSLVILCLPVGSDDNNPSASIAGAGADEVNRVVRFGPPAQQIIEEVMENSSNLIVLSAHGHSVLDGWASSIADRVIHSSPVSILLIPASLERIAPPNLQGPPVNSCNHCGRRSNLATFTSQDRCSRCQLHLKSRENCGYFDGTGCTQELPDAAFATPSCCWPAAARTTTGAASIASATHRAFAGPRCCRCRPRTWRSRRSGAARRMAACPTTSARIR